MKDYVIANGNEKEFIAIAEKLGYTELVFIDGTLPMIKSKIKLSTSKRIAKSDSSKDRMLIEGKRIDILYDLELEKRKDHTHFRNSGMNQVIAKLMKEKNVSYGVSVSQLLHANPEQKANILGRMLQNIKICKKYKVSIVLASFGKSPFDMRDPKDLVAVAKTLGLNDYKA
ncbi:MAG TPA: RNase P subunit p30 family protein [Candidatus Nanoarchaeia archaeon]|nr:RNase P subunit p30 family protein [Candidatus Nanoarchaeia archaeon]